jgi:hypothetical protein
MKTRLLPFTRDIRTADQRARGAAIEQERADLALEAEWRRRVRANPKEVSAITRRLAEVSR